MRFAPAAAALSLFVALTSSVGSADDRSADPRAAMLIAEGRAALAADKPSDAIDAFESAFAIDPAYTPVLLELAEAARKEGLQGKAIAYYREALARDPGNLAAISGEGEAMLEKGAVAKAQRNLAKLQSMCGNSCPETMELQRALSRDPMPRMAAESVKSGPVGNN